MRCCEPPASAGPWSCCPYDLPRDPRPELDAPLLRLAIPADFSALSLSDPVLALEWRLHARLLFQTFFARGYAVCGFTRSGGPAYLLERNA